MTLVPLLNPQTQARVGQWQSSARGISATSPSVPVVCFSNESLRGQDRLPQTQFPKVHGAWSRSEGLIPSLGLLLASTRGPE